MAKPECKRRRNIMNINDGLPPHIFQVILSKLPVLNLPVCRMVSKAWNDLILDYASTSKLLPNTFLVCTRNAINSTLSSLNRKIHCVDFDAKDLRELSFSTSFRIKNYWSSDVKLVNSCNGLLFVFKSVNDTTRVGILNPMTNEFIGLPSTDAPCQVFHYGFGFSQETKCYKVGRVSRENFNSKVEIFTIGGSNQWSFVRYLRLVVIENSGVYFHGNLYWIGIDFKGMSYSGVWHIYRLNVENESIEESMSLMDVDNVSIRVLNDGLYAIFFDIISCKIEVWKMQNFEGKESWSQKIVMLDLPKDWKLFQPRSEIYFQIIKLYEDGQILCLVNNDRFFSYNSKTTKIKSLNQIQPTNPIHSNLEVFVWFCKIESLNFSPLRTILNWREDA